ncbi:MAG TPA: 2Fe-2S iron-sulfur cluster-binding protein [Rhodopila sp.]|nr:2Fe-2S iron-sulfur cluster-binding protein [Rhodopila sp.]
MKATYIRHDGGRVALDIPEGTSLMRGAVSNNVDGIVGECGGQMMCATCHVYVDPEFLCWLPAVSEDEDAMLDAAACERKPNSRLSCQIVATDALDGIVVHMPETQL